MIYRMTYCKFGAFVRPKAFYGKSNFYLAYAMLHFYRNALTGSGAVVGRVRGKKSSKKYFKKNILKNTKS